MTDLRAAAGLCLALAWVSCAQPGETDGDPESALDRIAPDLRPRQLQALRLDGMAEAYAEQLEQGGMENLTFEERLALLTDRETVVRENRRLTYRLRRARVRENASIEEGKIDPTRSTVARWRLFGPAAALTCIGASS